MRKNQVKQPIDTAPIESRYSSSSKSTIMSAAPLSSGYSAGASSSSAASEPDLENMTLDSILDGAVENITSEYLAERTHMELEAATAGELDAIDAEFLPDFVDEQVQEKVAMASTANGYEGMSRARKIIREADGTVTLRFFGYVDVPVDGVQIVNATASPASEDCVLAMLQGKTVHDARVLNNLVTVTGISAERHVGKPPVMPLSAKSMVKPFCIEIDKVVPSMSSAVTVSVGMARKSAMPDTMHSSAVVLPDKAKHEKCVDIFWMRDEMRLRLAGAAVSASVSGQDPGQDFADLMKTLAASIQKYSDQSASSKFVETTDRALILHEEGKFTADGPLVIWKELPLIVDVINQIFQIDDSKKLVVFDNQRRANVTKTIWKNFVSTVESEAGASATDIANPSGFITLEEALTFSVVDTVLDSHQGRVADSVRNALTTASNANKMLPASAKKIKPVLKTPELVSSYNAPKVYHEKIMFSGTAVVFLQDPK